jgi:hypothetical protein
MTLEYLTGSQEVVGSDPLFSTAPLINEKSRLTWCEPAFSLYSFVITFLASYSCGKSHERKPSFFLLCSEPRI